MSQLSTENVTYESLLYAIGNPPLTESHIPKGSEAIINYGWYWTVKAIKHVPFSR
jgi:hypothetical protein